MGNRYASLLSSGSLLLLRAQSFLPNDHKTHGKSQYQGKMAHDRRKHAFRFFGQYSDGKREKNESEDSGLKICQMLTQTIIFCISHARRCAKNKDSQPRLVKDPVSYIKRDGVCIAG